MAPASNNSAPVIGLAVFLGFSFVALCIFQIVANHRQRRKYSQLSIPRPQHGGISARQQDAQARYHLEGSTYDYFVRTGQAAPHVSYVRTPPPAYSPAVYSRHQDSYDNSVEGPACDLPPGIPSSMAVIDISPTSPAASATEHEPSSVDPHPITYPYLHRLNFYKPYFPSPLRHDMASSKPSLNILRSTYNKSPRQIDWEIPWNILRLTWCAKADDRLYEAVRQKEEERRTRRLGETPSRRGRRDASENEVDLEAQMENVSLGTPLVRMPLSAPAPFPAKPPAPSSLLGPMPRKPVATASKSRATKSKSKSNGRTRTALASISNIVSPKPSLNDVWLGPANQPGFFTMR